MIFIQNDVSFAGFNIHLLYDDLLCTYTVDVRYRKSNGVFFSRDYKTKGSAMRSYNSWVSRLSSIDTRFSNVK